ncbi:MAG: phage protein Gp27 family protein [Pseudomonadota bacterium]
MAQSPNNKTADNAGKVVHRRKQSRPRRNAIDALPEKAAHLVQWVREELLNTRLNQTEILDELNCNLEELGIKRKISRNSMSNYAKIIMAQGHEIIHAREMAQVFINHMEASSGTDVELYVGELIKAAIAKSMRAIIAQDKPSMKDLREAATALYRLSRARATAHSTKRAILREIGDRVEEEGRKNGASPESIETLKDALGINDDEPDDTNQAGA